jgi:hypothetical protein
MPDDLSEVVDEIVDDMDPLRLENEAERLGVTVVELIDRVAVEAKARCSDD